MSGHPYQRSSAKPIISAEKVSAVRAIGALDPLVKNPDHLARHFLGIKHRILMWTLTRSLAIGRRLLEKKGPGIYWYLQARTKHIDHSLKMGVEDGIRQVVILGAGYDTRAYRFRDVFEGVQFYEVDIGATQMAKKHHLRKLFGAIPDQVTFVEMDFNRDSLHEQLLASGFDINLRTLFIMEGIIYYLPEAAVREVLFEIKSLAVPGSRIVLDYILTAGLAGDESIYGAKEAMKIWNEMGEPGLFGLEDPDAAEQFMAGLGFAVISDFDSAGMEKRYESAGRIIECMHLLDAEILP